MSLRVDDRREFQRIELPEPLRGTFADIPASIMELGVLGARVSLDSPLAEGTVGTLEFESEGQRLSFEASIARLPDSVATSHQPNQAGLVFLRAYDDSDDALRDALTAVVTQEIARIRPRPAAVEMSATFDPETTAMRIPSPFTSFRFENGTWQRRGVFIPAQPPNGFTVPAEEAANEMQSLCATYQSGTHEERHLIRLFAELRICRVLGAPPKA